MKKTSRVFPLGLLPRNTSKITRTIIITRLENKQLFEIETCFKKIGLKTRGEFLTFGARRGESFDYFILF
jgi:hypothetical protein